MRTVDQIIAHMKMHAGVSAALDLPQGQTWYDILNIAGETFVNRHSWTWLEKARADVAAIVGEDEIDLPRDFVSLTNCRARDSSSQVVRVVTHRRMEELRSNEALTGTSGFWYLCFDAGIVQKSPAGAPVPRALVWPTPTADGDPTLRIVYQRGWHYILPSEGSHVILIGSWCSAAFLKHCEVTAWEQLHNKPSPRRGEYEQVLKEAIMADEDRVDNVGQVGDRRRGDDLCDEDYLINEWTPN
jgi:hypothetical protein